MNTFVHNIFNRWQFIIMYSFYIYWYAEKIVTIKKIVSDLTSQWHGFCKNKEIYFHCVMDSDPLECGTSWILSPILVQTEDL